VFDSTNVKLARLFPARVFR